VQTLHDKVDSKLSTELDRIDIRNNKGVVKFVFVEGYWEIKIDGANGKVLQILHRRSDLMKIYTTVLFLITILIPKENPSNLYILQ
jgi:hypothetical protein